MSNPWAGFCHGYDYCGGGWWAWVLLDIPNAGGSGQLDDHCKYDVLFAWPAATRAQAFYCFWIGLGQVPGIFIGLWLLGYLDAEDSRTLELCPGYFSLP